jgi:tetratricopeptide (TPR) repeat protein
VPWEALLFGRGTANERAWVFILLARQQKLDAAVLVTGVQGSGFGVQVSGAKGSELKGGVLNPEPRTLNSANERVLLEEVGPADNAARSALLVAVRATRDGKEALYLFDPGLGLPIPAPEGVKLDDAGTLDIRPATLSQVVADDGLFRALDLEELGPYPLKSADLEEVVAAVEASPAALSVRMELIQSQRAADQELVLTTRPTRQAERFQACEHVAGGRLWTVPFETVRRRSQLSAGRVRQQLLALLPFYAIPGTPLREGRLRYLKGEFGEPDGATAYLQSARLSDRELAIRERTLAAQFGKPTRAAYPNASELQINVLVQRQVRLEMELTFLPAKRYASYWLGLIAWEGKDYRSAIDYFARRTLAASPNGPWTPGARYNLARTYEASGQPDKAIEAYQSDATSPARAGNLLRARWLKTFQQEEQKGDRRI